MKKITPIFVSIMALTLPGLAQANGFDSDLATTITGPLKIEVMVSEDLAYRANNLPKKLSDRGGVSRLNASFAINGKYVDREIEYLIEEMTEELEHDFKKYNVRQSDTADTILRVTIEMVKPNRPTYNQLATDIGLSFQSFGIGGADISAEVLSADGTVLGTMSYDFYSNLNQRPFPPVGIWQDTDYAFSRFARHATKKLAAMGATSESDS